MGTTVTTNLSLIKPDSAESIKAVVSPPSAGWAAQNAANCGQLDGLFKNVNSTYTPNLVTAGTSPTIGAGGFVEGKYLRLWPKMVFVHFRIFMGGAGFAAGTGIYRLSLPFAPASEFAGFNQEVPIGKAVILDADTVLNNAVMVAIYDIATGAIMFRSSGGNYWQPTNPFTLAQNDRVTGYVMYPTNAP